MSQHPILTSPLLQNYALRTGVYDELWRDSAHIHAHWLPLLQTLEALGAPGLGRVQQDVRRLLRENGVTYNVHGSPDGLQRPWPLDLIPLMISEEDWATIEAGVIQRAELLNLILEDLYGPRTLIQNGLLPLELIFSHEGFLRPCDGVRLPSERQLILYAADLARGPDGRMWVLGDRTQAPSGAGYALENRTVMGNVMRTMFREGQIHYLSNFFREVQATLSELAPLPRATPRIVLLTPGPYNETYFEQAYLAAYLGYSLVQGSDLTVVDGAVALKSLAGLQPVDVILRRVDDTFCDPLELRADSYLGVAGLLEAARRQAVAVVNPLGSSVLENAGLMPFLPGLAKHLLSQDLILPAAATWWCGQPRELRYVLDHLDELVIKRIVRGPVTQTVFGSRLSKKEQRQLRAQITAQPHLYVGQEKVSFSTAPCFIEGKLDARHTVLRTFAVARPGGYVVMPGGLSRSAANPGDLIVSNSAGGTSKDTWVLTSQPQQHVSLWPQAIAVHNLENEHFLPSRAAENLFWVGRYAERAEQTARLLRIILEYFSGNELVAGETETACLRQLLRALTQVTMTYPGFIGEEGKAHLLDPAAELLALSLDKERMGGLLSDVRSMIYAAYAVRDFWSADTWRVFNDIEEPWQQLATCDAPGLDDIQPEVNSLITHLMALAGLHAESMIHSERWLLLDIGRRLERAQRTVAFLRATLVAVQPQQTQHHLLETVLKTTETIITYRRRYRANFEVQSVLDLLLLDEKNPRALIYQFDLLQEHIRKLPRAPRVYRISQEEEILLRAYARLRLVNTDMLSQVDPESGLCQHLDALMAELSALLSQLSNVLTERYFTHAQVAHQFTSVQLEVAPQLEVGPAEGTLAAPS